MDARMLTYVVCEVCQNYRKKDKKYVPVRDVSESCPLQQRGLEEAPAASEAHAERSAKRRKSEKQVRHVEGAAARATGALANEPSSHSAGAAELTRDRVSFSLLSKKELDVFEKQFPHFCCPLCTSSLT